MSTNKPIIIEKRMGKVKSKTPDKVKYELDREVFIKWIHPSALKNYVLKNFMDDLIKGGEYIITAQDLLDQFNTLPMTLLVPGSQSVRKVKTKDIILTYKRP